MASLLSGYEGGMKNALPICSEKLDRLPLSPPQKKGVARWWYVTQKKLPGDGI